MNGFLAIMQVSRATLQLHASEVGRSFTVPNHKTNRSEAATGRASNQTRIAVAFLERYSELYGLPCPSGKGSNTDQPVR